MDTPQISGQGTSFTCLTNASFSGSTIFSLLIDSHPDIIALGDGLNPKILKRRHHEFLCSCGRRIEDCEFWMSVIKKVQDAGVPFSFADCNMRYSFLRPTADRIVGRYHHDPLRAGLRWFLERSVPAYRRHIRLHDSRNRAFVRAVTETSGKKVFIHNTKPLLMLHFLGREDPKQIRVINMVRDPRGFVYSASKRGMTVADAAARWRRYHHSVSTLLAQMPSKNVFNLRYEDVCEDADSAIEPVCAFLGVEKYPISQTITPKAHHVLGNDLRLRDTLTVRLDETWKTSLSASDIRLIGRICGPLAREFDYAL